MATGVGQARGLIGLIPLVAVACGMVSSTASPEGSPMTHPSASATFKSSAAPSRPGVPAGFLSAIPMSGVLQGDAVNSLVDIGGTLVAAGEHLHQGALWRTSDGKTWELIPGLPVEASKEGHALVHSMIRGPNGYVATGGVYGIDWGTPRVWFSADGLAWQSTFGPQDPYKGIPGGIDAVANWAFGYVAVGGTCLQFSTCTPQIWTSRDGVGWTAVDSSAFGGQSLSDVAAGEGTAVVVGGEGRPFVSRDGTVWSEAPAQATLEASNLYHIDFGAGAFAAAGQVTESGAASPTTGIWRSVDGLNWTWALRAPHGHEIRDVVTAPDGFVALGDDIPSNPAYDPTTYFSGNYTLESWVSADGISWRGPIVGYASGWMAFGAAFIGTNMFIPGAVKKADDPDFSWVVFRGVLPPA